MAALGGVVECTSTLTLARYGAAAARPSKIIIPV